MSHPAALPHDWFSRPLPANVVLGERSWLSSSYVFLRYRSRRPCGLRVGHDSGVYHGTFFDLGPRGEVEVGDYCTLVSAIISVNSRVVIEDYVFIAHEVTIADAVAAVPPAEDTPAGPDPPPPTAVVVRRNAWVCARATLLAGADVGEGAIVGAGAVVDFPVPAYAVVAGNPARVVGRAPPGAGR
jgi:acetyltransferase-like isoleucine patch superfamily enzyme